MSAIKNVRVGDVFAFKTVEGTSGIIKIISLETYNGGSSVFDVKYVAY